MPLVIIGTGKRETGGEQWEMETVVNSDPLNFLPPAACCCTAF